MIRIVLLKDVKGLGKKGDVVTAKEGYAINYLIPRKLARRATAKDITQFEDTNRFYKQQIQNIREFIANIKDYINREMGNRIEIERKSSPSGVLYDSIDEQELHDLIAQKASLLKRIKVKINIPDGRISKTGQWVVELEARHQDIVRKIPIIVYVTSGSRTRLKSDTLEPARRKI